jgi:hypothetical protein
MNQPTLQDWRRLAEGPAVADRPLTAALAIVASLTAALLAAHLPPLVPSGADLSDPAQAAYARNLWASAMPAIMAVAAICPLVVYGLVPPFMLSARKALLVVSIVGLCISGLFALDVANAYRQPPVPVTGEVTSFQGREISQCGFPSHHLLVSDAELREAHAWVKRGTAVLLYLTPSGDAAYLGPTLASGPCITSSLGG